MIRGRVTRRRVLGLGAAGMTAIGMTPGPFSGVGRAMAQASPDTVVYVSNAGDPSIGDPVDEPRQRRSRPDREGGDPRRREAVADQHAVGAEPRPAFLVRGAAQRAVHRRQLRDRPGERQAQSSRQRAARRQHGLYDDRPDRQMAARRLLSGRQADRQPDRRRGPSAGAAEAGHRRPPESPLRRWSMPRTNTSIAPCWRRT